MIQRLADLSKFAKAKTTSSGQRDRIVCLLSNVYEKLNQKIEHLRAYHPHGQKAINPIEPPSHPSNKYKPFNEKTWKFQAEVQKVRFVNLPTEFESWNGKKGIVVNNAYEPESSLIPDSLKHYENWAQVQVDAQTIAIPKEFLATVDPHAIVPLERTPEGWDIPMQMWSSPFQYIV